MTVEVSTTDPRSLKALAVLASADRWTKGHRKDDGRSFFVIPGSNGHTYYTDPRDCTCPDARERGVACKHQLAVRLWILGQKAGAPPPAAAAGDLVDLPKSEGQACDRCASPLTLVEVVEGTTCRGCRAIAAGSAKYAAMFSEDG